MHYRRDIDGLRAISVIAVILFHAGFSVIRGGFIGVDIFFVISGFLITSILLEEKETDTFSLLHFYERRARRILPALFIVLIATLPCAWLWLSPTDMKSFSQSLIGVATFSSNIFFYYSTGYFDTAAEWKPMLHTWSLSLEEQYYLIFPVFLSLAWKLGKRSIFLLIGLIAAVSLISAQWNSTHNIPAAFYLLPSRGWELLIGASTALYNRYYKKNDVGSNINQLGSLLGFTLISYAFFLYDTTTPFPGTYALMPTIGSALIILFSTPQTLVGKLLGTRVLVGVGLISYSAYLWHWPLFVFARHKSVPSIPTHLLLANLAVISLVLAYLSWRFIEKPFRNREKITTKTIVILGVFFSAAFIGLGIVGVKSNGFANRIPSATIKQSIEFPSDLNGWCFYEPDLSPSYLAGPQGTQCWLGIKTSNRKAILLGDSIAGNYEPFWDTVGKKADMAIHPVTTNYCVPAINEMWTGPLEWKAKAQCFYNRHFFLENIDKYDVAILAGNWMDYSTKNNMDDVLALIDIAAAKTKLVVIMAAPQAYDINPVDAYNKSLLEKSDFDISKIPTARDTEQSLANKLLENTAMRYKNVLYVDRRSLFNVDGERSEITKDKIPFSFDGLHISVYGSLSAAACFLDSQKYKDFITLQAQSQKQ